MNEKYVQLVEASPVSMIVIDKSGTITFSNAQAETQFGYAPGELLGKSVDILVPPRFLKQHVQKRIEFFDSPTPRMLGGRHYFYGLSKDGSEFRIEIALTTLENSGRVEVLASIVDIDERLNIENALAEKYEAIFNSIPNGIYVIDLKEYIIFYNKEIVMLLGQQNPKEKIADRAKDYGFFLPDQKTFWPPEQLPLTRVIKSGKSNGGIMFVKNKNKPEGIWITNYAYPLQNASGVMIGAVAILKEIVNSASQGFPAFGVDVPPLPL